MDIVEFEGTKHFFPKGWMEHHPVPKEYEDDVQAYYDEFHLAHLHEGVLYNFWGTIQIQVGEVSDDQLIDLVEKLIAFEITISDRLA